MPRGPLTLIVSAAVEALEGLGVLGFGAYAGWSAVAGSPHDLASAIVLALSAVALGAGMLWVAWSVLRRQSWARTPIVLTQLFALILGYNLVNDGQLPYGLPLLVCGVLGLVAIFSPPTARALFDGSPTQS